MLRILLLAALAEGRLKVQEAASDDERVQPALALMTPGMQADLC